MKKLICTYVLISLAGFALAQDHNEQVTVIAPYQPTVIDAYKINVNPKTIDTSFADRSMYYDILSRKIITSFGIENIKPAKVSGEPINKLSPLFVKAGFGNYKTPYLEAFYGSTRSKKWQYGAHVKHLSSQGELKDAEFNHMNSINQMEIFGSMYLDEFQMQGEVFYDRQRFSPFYGIARDSSYDSHYLNDENLRRVYSNVGVKLTLGDNRISDDKLKYVADLSFNNLQTNFGGQETTLKLGGDVFHKFDFSGPFSETFLGATLDMSINNSKANLGVENYAANTIKVQPYGRLNFAGHDLKAGLKFNVYTDEFSKLQFVPSLEAKFNLIPKVFAIFLGMDGDVKYHNIKSISDINPFLNMIRFQPELNRDYYIGISTSLSKRMDLRLLGQLTSYKNLLVFQNDQFYLAQPAKDLSVFRTEYLDASCVKIQADLNYYIDETFVVNAMGRMNYFDEDVPYKPRFEATLNLRYSLQDKIIFKSQLYAYSKMNYSMENPDLKVKGSVDWSLGAEYRFNRRYSAFLDINNLLNQRYFRWYEYPSYRLNFIIGATFTL